MQFRLKCILQNIGKFNACTLGLIFFHGAHVIFFAIFRKIDIDQ